MRSILVYMLLSFVCIASVYAQERVAPIDHNPLLTGRKAAMGVYKSTALSLPIFEDFTGYSPYPDSTIWADEHVYVNNTMGLSPVSRGVATFDALNKTGKPYDTIYNTNVVYADSLTLKPIDLSALMPADSVFLSFYYQPGGRGFNPETQDSLLLLFRKSNGTWVKVWSKEGSVVDKFKQVILPLNDTSYFYSDFQFRFVNKATINTNDDVWNVDYIRMAANRTSADTAINDLAYVSDPGYMLNDYTYMPYRHYLANVGGELASQMVDSIRNGYNFGQNVTFHFTARESISNTPLFSNGAQNTTINAYSTKNTSEPTYTNTVPIGNLYDKVIFENKFYFQSVGPDPKVNDTIVREQIFDNYLAYDDGTAEKSYYLNMFPSLPGKIAIEHHLNQGDSLQGVAIYFGRQVPVGTNKIFSIAVYNALAGVNGAPADQLLLQQDFMYPRYFEVNNYCTYKLDNPIALPAGEFYIATIQPALSGSDSLYFGLDVNRVQGNHAYYNVDGTWNSSSVGGAIMIRPLVGQTVFNTYVNDEDKQTIIKEQGNVSVYPNPATDKIVCQYAGSDKATYYISDIQGRLLKQGSLGADKQINIGDLTPGMYLVRLTIDGVNCAPQKIIKQ